MIVAEAEVIIRPVSTQFASQLDRQVQTSVLSASKKANVNVSAIDKGGSVSKLDKALQGVGKSGTVTGTVLSKLGAQGGTLGQVLGGALPTAALAGAAAITAFAVKGVRDFLNLAGEVRQFQIISGATAQDSSRIIAAASALGVSAQAAGQGVFILGKNLEKTGPKLAALGVDIAKTAQGNLDVSATFLNVADAVSKTSDPAKRALIAFTAFGRGGKALLPVLTQGREAIQALFDEAAKHGQILDQKQVDQAFKFQLALHSLGEEASKFGRSLGSDLIPALTDVAKGFEVVLQGVELLGHGIGLVKDGIKQDIGFLQRNVFTPLGQDFHTLIQDPLEKAGSAIAKFFGIPQDKTFENSVQKAAGAIQELDVHSAAAVGILGNLSTATVDSAGAIDKQTLSVDRNNRKVTLLLGKYDALNNSISHFSKTLDDTLGVTLNLQDVTARYDQDLAALNKSLKDNGTTFDLNTEKGRGNSQALRTVVKDIEDQISALVQSGSVTASDTAQKAQLIRRLQELQDKFPGVRSQVTGYIADVQRTPATKTTKFNVDTTPARKALDSFQADLKTFGGRIAKQGLLNIDASVAAKVQTIAAHDISMTAANVTILNKKGLMAGGFLRPGEVALTGERGPELQVGGPVGTTIIANNKLSSGGISAAQLETLFAELFQAFQSQRPITVNEVAQDPQATARAVSARIGLASIR